MSQYAAGKRFSTLLARLACAAIAISPSAGATDLPVQSILPAATTYNRAQVLDWIDDTRFALGRWDGTVSIFRVPGAGEFGPVIEQAWAAGSGRGIEMLTAIDDRTVVVSDGPDRLAVWRKGANNRFSLASAPTYDAKFGTANSGVAVTVDRENWFVSGHENGHALVWKRRGDSKLLLIKTLDLHSANPVPAPFPLKNIRDLVRWREHAVIAASEDGDLVAVDIPSGTETFRHRYNTNARRGINDLAVSGDWLLVANCSVGTSDSNLWLFDLSGGTPRLSDSANLALDTQRSQVFNFDVEFVGPPQKPGFFSSTEEGLLWRGDIADGQLVARRDENRYRRRRRSRRSAGIGETRGGSAPDPAVQDRLKRMAGFWEKRVAGDAG